MTEEHVNAIRVGFLPKMAGASSINPGALLVACITALYGIAFFANGSLNNLGSMTSVGLIPYDSLHYVDVSENLTPNAPSFLAVLLGALNWLSLSFVFGFLQEHFGVGGLAFVLLNSYALYLWLAGSAEILELRDPLRSLLPMIALCLLPFIWGWILAPNKEILVGAFFVCIYRRIAAGRIRRAALLSIVAALIKIQLLVAIAIFMIFKRFRFRKLWSLVAVSVALPVIIPFDSALTMDQFLENQQDVVRTGAFFSTLDVVNQVPGGFIVVGPIRIFANFLGGISPVRLFSNNSFGDVIAPATSFFLGILAIFVLTKSVVNGDITKYWRASSLSTFYLHSLLVALALVPFLQPRYFWWAVPLMIGWLFKRPSALPGAGRDT